MDHRTTNKPFSYLRPTLQMPSPYVEQTLFPNSPRSPEKNRVKFYETAEDLAATPSEPSVGKSNADPSPGASPAAKTTAEKTPVRTRAAAMAPATVASGAKTTSPMAPVRARGPTPRSANLFLYRDNPLFLECSSSMTAEEEADGYSPIERQTGEDEVALTKDSQGTTVTAGERPITSGVYYAITGAVGTLKNLNLKTISVQGAVAAVFLTLIVCLVVTLLTGRTSRTGSDHNIAGSSEKAVLPVGGGRKAMVDTRGEATAEPETSKQSFTLVDYEETKAPGGDPANPPAFECDTDACQWQRRLVDDKLDLTSDPCVDFYSYVCSPAWELSGDLPYRAAGTVFLIKEVTRYLQEHMHVLPEAAGDGEHNFLDHASLLLSACLNNTAPRGVGQWDGVRAMLRMVGLEDWPYLEPPLPPPGQSFRLQSVLKLVDLQLAIFPIIHVSLRKSDESGPYDLYVDAPRNFLFVQYELQKDNESLPYKEIVRQTLVLWKTLPDSNSMAEDIVLFEGQLLGASEPFAKSPWAKNAVYATKKFPRLPKFNVPEYLLYLRKSSEQTVLLNPAYLSKLSTILRKQTPRTILNFLGFLVVVQIAPLLPYELIPRELIRVGYPSFQHYVGARTQSCFHMVNRLFPHGVRWIVRDILAKTTDLDIQWTSTIEKMVSSLGHTLRSGSTWMHKDDVTGTIARLKSLHVGYLAGQEPEEDIRHYYAAVNAAYRPNSLVRYYGRLLAASLRKYWASKGGGANYDARFTERSTDLEVAWMRSPESTLRVYLASSSVVAASLVTRADYPSSLLPLMAADVTQALFSASLDDPQWSGWTQDRFHALQYCLLERYKRGVRRANASAANVRAFLAVILADNAAIKPLMDAFRRFSHGAVFVPGRWADRLSVQRLFFVNYAAGFCVTKKEEEQIRERLRYRLNLPPRVRVNLALLDLKEFRDAFGCPHQLGAPRCPVWKQEEPVAAED
ncbi:neprilysin-1-like [Haemaphysalis longicornis]